MIDRQLTDQIDYRLSTTIWRRVEPGADRRSSPSITDAPAGAGVPQPARRVHRHHGEQAQIESTTGQSLQAIEWVGLLLLLLILMALIVVLPADGLGRSSPARWPGLGHAGRAAAQARPPALARAQFHLEPTTALPEHGAAPYVRGSHRRRSLPAHRRGPGGRLPGSVSNRSTKMSRSRIFRGRVGGRHHGSGGRSRQRR